MEAVAEGKGQPVACAATVPDLPLVGAYAASCASDTSSVSGDEEEMFSTAKQDPNEAFCEVCRGGESVKGDVVIICDGCEIAVHQGCYGVEEVPSGEWLCRPCATVPAGLERKRCHCVICGKPGGALKPTEPEGAWAHLWCVWWDPNAHVETSCLDAMEPVRFLDNSLALPPSGGAPARPAWACCVCKEAAGYFTVKCFKKGCDQHFHPSCAKERGSGCYISVDSTMSTFFKSAYCPQHAEDGLDAVTVIERLCKQATALLECSDGSPACLARPLMFVKKMLIVKDRVQGRAPVPPRQYDSPDSFQHEVLGHIASLPGNTSALRKEFMRLFKMWARGRQHPPPQPEVEGGKGRIEATRRSQATDAGGKSSSSSGGSDEVVRARPVGDMKRGGWAMGKEEIKQIVKRAKHRSLPHERDPAVVVEGGRRRKKSAKAAAMEEVEQEEEEEEEEEDEEQGDLEDAVCDVCGSDESLEDDPIVACDGCDVPVHQSCYGITNLPDGDWFCALCVKKREWSSGGGKKGGGVVSCHFCRQTTGAMKCTRDGSSWAHVQCVWYDPDAIMADPVKMEPIVLQRRPDDGRVHALCCLCHKPGGVCVRCRWMGCHNHFHVRCARDGGFLSMEPQLGSLLTEAYCDVHQHQRLGALEIARMVRQGLVGTPLSRSIAAIERRLNMGADEEDEKKHGAPYRSFEELSTDLMPLLDTLAARPAQRALAQDLKMRLSMLKRSLDDANIMLSQRLGRY